jgi:ribosomal protein S18 acetylase RimI-like enzyme
MRDEDGCAVTPSIRDYDDDRDRVQMIALYSAAWHATYDAVDGAAVIDRLIADLLRGDQPEMFELPVGDLALVAEQDGKIVGGVRGHPREGLLHLSGMYVDPRCVRSGIGRALLSALFGRYPAGTVVRADVRPTSHTALDFYARLGFLRVGRNRTKVGGDLWSETVEMQRTLK